MAAAGRAAVVSWAMAWVQSVPSSPSVRNGGHTRALQKAWGSEQQAAWGRTGGRRKWAEAQLATPPSQDAEPEEAELAPWGGGEDGAADAQNRMQVPGLHRPDPL